MKVALAQRYRMWMLVLLPATAGVGTIALWLRTLKWPLNIDKNGVTLRYRRRIDWDSITKIGLSRSYLDGRCAHLRIHHEAGICKVPLYALRDGQGVVNTILTMFDQACRQHVDNEAPSVDSGKRDQGAAAPHDLPGPGDDREMHEIADAIGHLQGQATHGALG